LILKLFRHFYIVWSNFQSIENCVNTGIQLKVIA